MDPRQVVPESGSWTSGTEFIDNADFGFDWPEGCYAAMRFTRLTGLTPPEVDRSSDALCVSWIA